MSLRVAFDLDGTVADMGAALLREAQTLFASELAGGGPETAAEPPGSQPEAETGAVPALGEMALSARQQVLLWDHVRSIEDFWTTLPEIEPGIIARIAQTATARRWETLFITTRPPTSGEPTQLQSQRWLNAHGFPFPSVYVLQRSRGRLAEALGLDAVVDDRPENCLDVAVESKARSILVWPGPLDVPSAASRLGVEVVTSISEALDSLERLDDTRQRSPMMRSIRRLLGRDRKRRQQP
jgi:hypothetical protein